jgi:hypothetical protein
MISSKLPRPHMTDPELEPTAKVLFRVPQWELADPRYDELYPDEAR